MAESLADIAVRTLSNIRNIDSDINNDHALRYSIRGYKQVAEEIIFDAFAEANRICELTHVLKIDYAKETNKKE